MLTSSCVPPVAPPPPPAPPVAPGAGQPTRSVYSVDDLRREAQAFGARDTSCDPSAVTVVTWLIGRERDAMVVDACGQRLVYVCGFEPCLLVSRMALGKAAPPSADRP